MLGLVGSSWFVGLNGKCKMVRWLEIQLRLDADFADYTDLFAGLASLPGAYFDASIT